MSAAAQPGRIGPNAVIRLAEALDATDSHAATVRLFRAAGFESFLAAPPTSMVAEEGVTALHRELRSEMGPQRAATVSWIAGLRTAEYLLGHRIPKRAQQILKYLPRRLAAFILLKAIGSHAWTFAGSSRFTWHMGKPVTLSFDDCPLCRNDQAAAPCCHYYAACFEHLFRTLVDADTRVAETHCIAAGAPACRFEIRFRGS